MNEEKVRAHLEQMAKEMRRAEHKYYSQQERVGNIRIDLVKEENLLALMGTERSRLQAQWDALTDDFPDDYLRE